MDVKKYDMEHDMASSRAIIKLLEDSDTAAQFYSALCNVEWVRISKIPEDERIVDALRGVDSAKWSCSWRYAGGLVAQIRAFNYNVNEDYMDFYCCGNEGHVTELVREALAEIGWEPLNEWNSDV